MLARVISTILGDWNARWEELDARYFRHKQAVQEESWVSYLEQALPDNQGKCKRISGISQAPG